MKTPVDSAMIRIEPIDSVSTKVIAVFDPKSCARAEEAVLKAAQANVVAPGFRKGKVPPAILKQRYGERLKREVRDQLIRQALDQATQKEHLSIAAITDIDDSELFEQHTVRITVELKPDIAVPDFKDFKLDPLDLTVSELEVSSFIERLRKQYASYNPVNRAAQNKDYVKLSYEGFVGEKAVDDFDDVQPAWCRQKGTWQEAGIVEAGEIPEIAEGLVGMGSGDQKEIRVTFPENCEAVVLRKQEALYKVQVLEVREVLLPELDAEFFKKMQVKDLEELKAHAERIVKERKQSDYASQQKQRIAQYLIRSVNCDLPPTWVRHQTDRVLQDMVNVFASHGVKEQEMEEQKKLLYEKAKEAAMSRIKIDLCFEKLSEKEHLVLEEDDVRPVLIQEAQRMHTTPQKLLQTASRDKQVRVDIQGKAFQIKLFQWLFDKLSKEQQLPKQS